MHPDFHAIDFSLSNPQIVYFGNDGGIYGTLNGPGMNVGTCGAGVNPVTSLNGPIGSLAQFISISHHPTNASIVLGGTQDNGSPATTTADTGTLWKEVNLGDGGYNEIDPNNPLNLFTANTDVTIQRCSASSSDPTCVSLPFNYLVNCCVAFPEIGIVPNFPDHGDFYAPYILDPQNTNNLIIGTCRVWRGSASDASNWTPTSFGNALSNKFTDGTASACSATEPFYVRSLDAGGPTTPNGSQVVYAGTSSGSVFVTTNAVGGPGTWVDRTGSINPNHYPISSIAVDRSDPTGNTGYLTMMGFSGGPSGHIFKTTNAGVSWSDITNNLPDAPANSILIDPRDNTVLYVGTDVGVFISIDSGASWHTYGHSLPNVVVNKLRAFSSGSVTELRASSHGRGVWQTHLFFPGDFAISSPTPNAITTFPTLASGPTTTFTVSATGVFTGTVTLGCLGLPAGVTCNFSPSSTVNPTRSNPVALTLTISSSAAVAGVTAVTLTADSTGLIEKTQSFSLTVEDYTLSISNPTVAIFPTQSAVFNGTLTSLQGYNSVVNLSCVSAPLGCNFSPGSSATPTDIGTPFTASLTTTGGTTIQDYTFNIRGVGTDAGSTAHAPAVTMQVVDYTIGTPSPSSVNVAQGNTSAPIALPISGLG
jgi:hypothetical protein